MSIIAAADVTCGLIRAIAELLHLPSTDLALLPPFLPPYLASRAFQTQRAALILHARERAARAKEGKGNQSLLKESVAWMMADDGLVPLLMMSMDGPHMLLQTTNRPYDKLVAGAQSLHEHCLRKKTIQVGTEEGPSYPDVAKMAFWGKTYFSSTPVGACRHSRNGGGGEEERGRAKDRKARANVCGQALVSLWGSFLPPLRGHPDTFGGLFLGVCVGMVDLFPPS
jgi:hypothetical protein